MNTQLIFDGCRSIELSVLAYVTLLILFIHIFLSRKTGAPKYQPPPQAPSSSFACAAALKSGQLHLFLLKCAREVGPVFRCRFFHRSFFVINDVNASRKILSNNSYKKTDAYKSFRSIHGQKNDILTSQSNSYWKHARKSITPAFSAQHIRRMNRVVVDHTNKLLSSKFEKMAKEGLAFDPGEEMVSLTLGIICETAFEYRSDQNERCMFVEELQIVLTDNYKSRAMPFRKIFARLIPSSRRACVATEKMVGFAEKIIDSYRKLEVPLEGTAIDLIMKNDSYENDLERVADILILLIAGHDTTAYSLAWILIELAKNPIEQTKLHNKLMSVTMEERRGLDMLKYVIKEGMRFRPVVAGVGRIANVDTLVKQRGSGLDFVIPKGTPIVLPNLSKHMDSEYYEDPDVFKPSRWENPSKNAIAALIPFGLGQRNCLGQSLAKAELHSVLAVLCTEYHFSVQTEGTSEHRLTTKPKGFLLQMTKY